MNYNILNTESIVTPALVFYLDGIKKNTEKVISICGDPALLWPHVKTHKCSEIVKMQLDMGIRKFKCATIAELKMVCKEGADAALFAFAPSGPTPKLFLELMKQYPKTELYAIVDCLEHIRMYSEAADSAGSHPVNLLLDINNGLNRTGVSFAQAEELYKAASSVPNDIMCGFHFYDGNRHEKDPLIRQTEVDKADTVILEIRHRLQQQGYLVENLVMGCSPSFPCHVHHYEEGMYFSPGTLFLNDSSFYGDFKDLDMEPAAAIMTRVISHPGDGLFTLDCGCKGIASDPPAPFRGQLVNVDHCVPILQNEEHWVFRMSEGYDADRPPINSVVYVIPMHICPCSVLYPYALVVDKQNITNKWKITARDRI